MGLYGALGNSAERTARRRRYTMELDLQQRLERGNSAGYSRRRQSGRDGRRLGTGGVRSGHHPVFDSFSRRSCGRDGGSSSTGVGRA